MNPAASCSPLVLCLLLLSLVGGCNHDPASEDPKPASASNPSASGSGTTGSGSSGAAVAPGAGSSNGYSYAFAPDSVAFDCADAPEAITQKGAVHLTSGNTTIFVGYEQVAGTDQDPIVARYDGAEKVFCEHSKKGGGIDSRAYGLTWDGGANLYVVYSVVGGGTLFDTVAQQGWLKSYGDGGASSKVTVIGKVDTETGVVEKATFVAAKLPKNGQLKTNTLIPADALHALPDGNFEFFGTPAYCTLNPDQSLMCDTTTSKDYPKDYRARFTADLGTMTCASATGVSVVKTPCP